MSFKRKTTRQTTTTPLVSTGIHSLDDILGGGLPLSCSLVLTAPDLHSEYDQLVLKYFLAQGLASNQRICVVGSDAEIWTGQCMWLPPTSARQSGADTVVDEDTEGQSDEKIKIAWRYEQMKPFQTTVGTFSSTGATVDLCCTFDLTTRIPPTVIADAVKAQDLLFLSVDGEKDSISTTSVLKRLEEVLANGKTQTPLRVCIPDLGSPSWGDLNAENLLHFLHSLRALLRRYPHACACVSLATEWSADHVSAGWFQKLGWMSDGAITLDAFSGNPALAAAFPGLHGLLRIHTLPAPTTLVAASDRFSTLRGTGTGAGSGENNLGFKCTRKRLVFETVHLDVEGGVGERRTTAPPSAVDVQPSIAPKKIVAAVVEVELEGSLPPDPEPVLAPVKKSRKRVGFQSDRPEVYDF